MSGHDLSEPAEWVPPEEVQEQQWLAEAVGRLHQLLPLLLQNISGTVPGDIYSPKIFTDSILGDIYLMKLIPCGIFGARIIKSL